MTRHKPSGDERLRDAERRIEEARRTRAESLNLGDLALSELPASLGDLPDLRELYLGTYQSGEDGQPHQVSMRDHPNFSDLSPLAGLTGLRGLSIGGCGGVQDLSPIVGLQALQNLFLAGTSVNDLAPIAKLKKLRILSLGFAESGVNPDGTSIFHLASSRVADLTPISGLRDIQALDLTNSQVIELAPLAELLELQSLDLSLCRDLTDLVPLVRLTRLQSLNLQWCERVVDLAPIAEFKALQSLDLAGSRMTNLAHISGLRQLQNLRLDHCTRVADFSPIAELKTLQSLDLSGTQITNLTPISGLIELQSLDLNECMGVSDLAPIAEFKALQSLDLSATGVTSLALIAGFKKLQRLNLEGCKSVMDLSPIAELKAVQYLNLSRTGVTDLAPIARLKALTSLDLAGCQHVADLTPIAQLKALLSLDLSGTGVTNLAPISGLKQLQRLRLQACKGVADLAPSAGLQALYSLDLSMADVGDLGPLRELRGLRSLNLLSCYPSVSPELLRVFAAHPCLTELFADKATGVPREVLSRDSHDDCLPRLRAHLADLNLGAKAENEVKVILLGNGRVGKTQLCRRFRGEPFDSSIPSTHGVQIWREALHLRAGGEEQVFLVNWWDFGGQDIYHGTHALFLRSRAVFLILWTPGLENRDEYTENGIPLRNQPLAYWLDYVRSLAGADSPVIVVQSQCDRFAEQRPVPPIPEGLGFVQCCFYSAKQDLGRETLESQLRNAIGYLFERTGALEIGRGRAEVRRRLYARRAEDQQRQPAERQNRTLTLDQFRALCEEVGDIVSWKHALGYFHQTGVVFHRPDLFSNRIVLDQSWALDAIYTVFHRAQVAPFLRDSGRFTREDLAFLAWQEHSIEEQKLFLGLMEGCGVCFPIGKTAQGEARYVAPDLLPPFEAITRRVQLTWKFDAETATLRLEYRFLHPAIIRGLMRKIGQQAQDFAEYWKYGFWLKDGTRDSQLLVHFVDTSSSEAPGAGALELKAQGSDPLGLLREIRRAVDRQRIGEEPEELLMLGRTTVARGSLFTRTNDGHVLDTSGNWVPAVAFTAFFEGHEHRPEEAPTEAKPSGLDITPQAPRPAEKASEVFISYAWGDDKTRKGKLRAEVVDALEEALQTDGFVPVRDRDQIKSGDLISRFITQLTRADLVVAVISDKYLRSPYCMYEIYKLWQKAQGDPELMVERLVPIVLPEVKVCNFEGRAPYLELWSERAEKLEGRIRNPKLRPGRESWEEVRLIREFSHHIDDILVFLKDILMPRQLDAHLDQGLPAVLEALRRRIKGD